ncbi:MAG: hypothetical protein SNJ67_14530 [Chloracidobacterium sp.]|uniref:Uncharacterized protein n=1 Tax=Chloracidobacterium validum TaxID=2821543 RepID=A0ABX8BAY5_9BACT|nr:hypothetical protein [Chloracidobacterium validum]QUW03844.1 hypothetical protein J8C06_05295 [Chloracidobacterium validum]
MEEQFPYMADGLAYLAQVETLKQSDPLSPYLAQPEVTESYQRWQSYFQSALVTPVIYQSFLAYLGKVGQGGDLANYLQRRFPPPPTAASTPSGNTLSSTRPIQGDVILLDQLITQYRREQIAQGNDPDDEAEAEIERSLTPDRPASNLTHLSPAELITRIERLEQDNRSLRKRLQVKLGRRDLKELEDVVADYERRMHEAERQLDDLRRAPRDSDKLLDSSKFTEDVSLPPGTDDPEAERQRLEKKYQKTLAEVAILAQGMLNHLTTFLNDKACMVGPGEQFNIIIKFPEMQAPVVQMIRKLKQIEDISKRRCGIPELNELVDQLFGTH